MTQTDTDISTLVGSRICHDLISPLGAIANGIELMSMSGLANSPEIALIAESIECANARVRFFRIAYGTTATEQRIGRAEIVSILTDMSKGGRLTYKWDPASDILRQEVRLLFLLCQCLETAMPYGGVIRIEELPSGWRLTGLSEKVKITPETWDVLNTSKVSPPVAAAEVQFALAGQVLADQGRVVNLTQTETGVILRL
ncbi:histidine phosphotransferase family protein [Algirhabdus cladophorae]|uniref:histidine phosphotransferase family protein n=1 Tax=Algirhabdus cladophorae TaxID=3377108 RepID=UPI003B849CED